MNVDRDTGMQNDLQKESQEGVLRVCARVANAWRERVRWWRETASRLIPPLV